mgnify:CR=1 FL=1
MEKLKSRKLWVATITAVVLWITTLAGVELDVEQVVPVLLPIIAYILGQSLVDARNGSK